MAEVFVGGPGAAPREAAARPARDHVRSDPNAVLELAKVCVDARVGRRSWLPLVKDVSLTIRRGETAVLVGESGSGKSILLKGVLGLLNPDVYRVTGDVMVNGVDVATLSQRQRRLLLGKEVGVVFQDPYSALDPVMTVGAQVREAVRIHSSATRAQINARVLELLDDVGIPDVKERAYWYPHEFSGGMRQRIMIALALANEPRLIVADEPTTALDVTTQAEILRLFMGLQTRLDAGVVFVTHDLTLASEIGDSLRVMYAGRIVEHGPAVDVLDDPHHPYTFGLKESLPKASGFRSIPGMPLVPGEWPPGCPFAPRCHAVIELCDVQDPQLTADSGRQVACHRADGDQAWYL